MPLLFRIYSKLKHYDGKFKYGVYSFNSEIGYEGIADMLMNDGAKAESVNVTIVEGSNVDEIAELLPDNPRHAALPRPARPVNRNYISHVIR